MYREETREDVRLISGLPVDTDLLFVDKKGNYKASIERKRTKLLHKLGFLVDFLDEDEQVVFVTTGCSPASSLEQCTMGYLWVTLIKRALFVFTTKRILHIPTTAKYEYRGSIAQIMYQDCQHLFVKGTTLHATYQTGKKESFFGIPRSDGAIIRRMSITAPEPAEPSVRPERNHLCPSCVQVQDSEPATCPGCGLAFKTKAEAVKYSVLLPGGGYFYVRRWPLGVLDAIGETYLTIMTIAALAGATVGTPGAAPAFVFIGVLLAIEKLITIYHARKFVGEFIPRSPKPVLPHREPRSEQPRVASTQERAQGIEQVLSVR